MSQIDIQFSEEEVAAAQALWEKCALFLSTVIEDKAAMDRWIKPIEPRGYKDKELILYVPTQEFYYYLIEHYTKEFNQLQMIYLSSTNSMLSFVFKSTTVVEPEVSPRVADVEYADKYESIFNDKLNFETFLESKCNRYARILAEAVAVKPGQAPHSVLFIYGPSGVGKTHLSQAIGQRVRSQHPEKRVCYVSCAKFEGQFVTECKDQRDKQRFLKFYQAMDVLIIDDIQSLVGKTKTQQAFFEIFNHLYLLGRQIVLTCDVPPKDFQDIEERIITRIQGSMIVELERPDIELRHKILQNRMAEAGVQLSPEVEAYIVEHAKNNVRELEGPLLNIIAYAKIYNQPLDISLVSRILGQSINLTKPEVTMEKIVSLVATEYGVELSDLHSSSRAAKIALPRQIVMYLTNKHTEQTLVTIAKKLKRKNHTTIMHGIKAISNRIDTDQTLRASIEQIEQRLLSAAS